MSTHHNTHLLFYLPEYTAYGDSESCSDAEVNTSNAGQDDESCGVRQLHGCVLEGRIS